MMRKKISVILPTYNEKDNISRLVADLYRYLGKYLKEIIVVDDNSPDETWKIVKALSKIKKNLRLIRRSDKRGLPSAIATGIENAKGTIVVWLDCDFSHPPDLIKKMINYIPKYDVVMASRYVQGGKDKRNFLRRIISKVLNLFGSTILNVGIKDLTSGFYAVKKSVFKDIRLKQDGYAEYCIKFALDAKRKGYKIKEVPYIFVDRKKGYSKSYKNLANFIKNGYLCVKEILRLRFVDK